MWWVFCTRMCAPGACSAHTGQKRGWIPLELKLQTGVSHHVGTGNWTWVLPSNALNHCHLSSSLPLLLLGQGVTVYPWLAWGPWHLEHGPTAWDQWHTLPHLLLPLLKIGPAFLFLEVEFTFLLRMFKRVLVCHFTSNPCCIYYTTWLQCSQRFFLFDFSTLE